MGIISVFIPKIISRFVVKQKSENTNDVVRCPIYEDVTEDLKFNQQNSTFMMEQNSAYDK